MKIEDKLKLILLEEFNSEPSKIQSYLNSKNSLEKVMKALNKAFDLGVSSLPLKDKYKREFEEFVNEQFYKVGKVYCSKSNAEAFTLKDLEYKYIQVYGVNPLMT